jgi:predicted transcriptional regulator
MRPKSTIGRAEMEVLRYIADHPAATVGEVGEHLAKTKGQTRNTASNMMERLRTKGYLERERVEGIYRYTAPMGKVSLLKQAVEDFVDSTLGGSVSPLIAYLTEHVEVSEEQLVQLKSLLNEIEEKNS